MQFLLANPAWLWLLSLGLVPVLVHLFARSNPPKYAFSSTEFLRRILKKTARMRKPQDWLLLLLRTLAVLALLFVFLQPLLTGGGEALPGKKTTVYLIDRSASMACKEGASSRFDGACAKAVELMDSAGGDDANVVWIDAQPEAVFPQPGQNIAYLQDALKRGSGRAEQGAIAAALSLALGQLNLVEGARELVIISDFQASAWKEFQLQVPKDIKVVKVRVGDEDTGNLAVSELFATPSNPVVGQDVVMVCRLRNFSDTPRRTTLYLESGGGRQSRDVEVPAWGEAEANFSSHFASPGQVQLSASIGEDAFTGDNTRHALVQVRDTLKMVSLPAAKGSAREQAVEVLDRLAASLEWLDHSVVESGALPSSDSADFVFVHAWDGENTEALKALAAAGTSVFVHPAAGVTLTDCQSLLDVPVSSGSQPLAMDTKGSWKAGISRKSDANAKVFELFKTGEFGNPAAGSFKERLRLPSAWPETVTHLIDYNDDVPGLLAAPAANVIIWNLPLSNSLSSWSGQSSFVPFMGELLLNSRASQKGVSAEVLPGTPLSWAPGEGVTPDSVTLFDDANTAQPTETRMTATGAQLTSTGTAAPGVYQWKIGDGLAHVQVSNFPATESDLRLMDPAEVQGGEVVDSQQLLRRAALGDGIPLWPWFLCAAFLFLILESLVSMWKPKPAN
ncbi:BatA and WFA domain-containing protein [Verrucomicrobiaceae bacterium 5K15]|uniref:BatA and WFA domain-containing protein n=1 Tax=Oceaniferula flava TaxID=2800421 RepID=A0AAE2VAM6_9BACT|nr:BatA domain-containing protein [Oceaniferula flavus]MBK1853470.1 BatA and WFA domain-containing protein [Oceaniferula flavus]MBM1134775.1 BatA and WFA domain-containing protein [Oceaniferula flavus]